MKVTDIKETQSGDYIYEIEMDIEFQNKLTEEAKKLDMTTEEFIERLIRDRMQEVI